MMKTIKDNKAIGINKETIFNRTEFREAVRKFEIYQEGVKTRMGNVYSKERR